MKRMLPVEELARDERFERIRIEDVVFDPRNAVVRARSAAATASTPSDPRRPTAPAA